MRAGTITSPVGWAGVKVSSVLAGAGGIVATITMAIGPMWYAVVVCLMAVPTASYGGALYERRAPR